ncbi:MAG TPA: hypothetical protein VE243_02935, partial [Candidatus Acidoferrum sp.]|nr:hypothetical protein [Candidatus Acidoferrum sp.]
METENTARPNEDKKSRWRFILGSAIAVIIVSAAAAGIVLASQMRLQRQTGELGAQIDKGPRVLVQPIHPAASASSYDIPITVRGFV